MITLTDPFEKALGRAFRDPVILEGVHSMLQTRRAEMAAKVSASAVAALHNESARPTALMHMGALAEIDEWLRVAERFIQTQR